MVRTPRALMVARFWVKVLVRGETECWEWLGCKDRDGYGQFSFEGRQQAANRVAWALTHGFVPDGKVVCHSCDNPSCVNPTHLFLGTHSDNALDRERKQRRTKIGNKFRIPVDIREAVRNALAGNLGVKETARTFGISPSSVRNIRAQTTP